MKVAIPNWQGRVSPVFDVAARVLVVDIEDGQIQGRQVLPLDGEDLHSRVQRLADTGVEVLICGVLSRPLALALASAGVEVVPQTCGPVEEVLAAFAAGRLAQDAFLMPGCCGRRRRLRGQCRREGPP